MRDGKAVLFSGRIRRRGRKEKREPETTGKRQTGGLRDGGDRIEGEAVFENEYQHSVGHSKVIAFHLFHSHREKVIQREFAAKGKHKRS